MIGGRHGIFFRALLVRLYSFEHGAKSIMGWHGTTLQQLVDAASTLEASPGIKDPERVRRFVEAARLTDPAAREVR